MNEEPKFVRIYQAQSAAPDLADGIEFQVEERLRSFEHHDEIDVTFSDGKRRTLYFSQVLDNPRGYAVQAHDHSIGTLQFNIVQIEDRKFRVVYPDHFKDLPPPWGNR